MFGKIKKKLADYLVKEMEETVYYMKYTHKCNNCVYYNIIVDNGFEMVDECLKGMTSPSAKDYIACNNFKLKKEKKNKTNLFGIEIKE